MYNRWSDICNNLVGVDMKKLIVVVALLAVVGCAGLDSGPTVADVMIPFEHAGDDGILGTASGYDFRYSADKSLPFDQWTTIVHSVVPQPGLTLDTVRAEITFPDNGTMYYFAAKAVDEGGLWSPMHLIDSAFLADEIPPANVQISGTTITPK